MARDIAEGLAARGRAVTVVTSHFDSGLPLDEEINGVRVLRAPVLARVGRGVVSPQLVALGRRTLGAGAGGVPAAADAGGRRDRRGPAHARWSAPTTAM
jgi:hypothetical protein